MGNFNRINLLTIADHLGVDCTINFQENTGYIEVWLQESKAPFKCQFALLNPKQVAMLREALTKDYSNSDCPI